MFNPSALKRMLGSADLRIVPLNGALFVISPRLYNMVKQWAQRPFLMLPPAPDDWFLRAADKTTHSPLRISFIGRIDPGKGAKEAVDLFYRIKDNNKLSCRFYGYTFEQGRISKAEEELYRRLKALPAGTFVESCYTTYMPEVDQEIKKAMAETDILLLPYRAVSSTADMPLVFMEGMASLCTLVIPQVAADLPEVYGPSKFYIQKEELVDEMDHIITSAGSILEEERRRSEERNALLNFGLAATATLFKRALLGEERPRKGEWPENLLSYQQK